MFNPSKPTADELNHAQAHKAFLVYDNEHVLFAQDAVGARFIHELESHLSGRSGIADGKEDEKIERLINERMQSKHIHVCAILVKLVIPPATE